MRLQAMFHEHVGALVVHYKARPAGAAQRTVLQRSIATQDNHVATQDNHVATQRSAVQRDSPLSHGRTDRRPLPTLLS